MRVNLLQKQKTGLDINWKNINLLIGVFTLFSFLGIRYFLTSLEFNNLKIEKASIKQQLAIYMPIQHEFQELRRKIDELKAIPVMTKEDYLWGDVIWELGFIVSSQMMLTSLQLSNNEIYFLVIAVDTNDVIQFIYNLNVSPFLTQVELRQINKKQEVNFQIEAFIEGGT